MTQKHIGALLLGVWLICGAILLQGATIRIPPARPGAVRVQAAGVAGTTPAPAPTWSRTDLVLDLNAASYTDLGAGQKAWIWDCSDRAMPAVMTDDADKPTPGTDASGGAVLNLAPATHITAATNTANLLTGSSFTVAFSGKFEKSHAASCVLGSYNSYLAGRTDVAHGGYWNVTGFGTSGVSQHDFNLILPAGALPDATYVIQADADADRVTTYINGTQYASIDATNKLQTFAQSMVNREYTLFAYAFGKGYGMAVGSYFRWIRVWRRLLTADERAALNAH
jgi:hypothetical protein